MNARAFHNALRILTSIEIVDLRAAGVIDENWGSPEASDRDQIGAFIRAPFDEALRMPDANFDRLFALIERRQPTCCGAGLMWEQRYPNGRILAKAGDVEVGAVFPNTSGGWPTWSFWFGAVTGPHHKARSVEVAKAAVEKRWREWVASAGLVLPA